MLQAAKKAYGQTASLDCHLAQTLVRRFMKGDQLSDALLNDVQKHLAVCADCMAVANGKKKPLTERKALPPGLAQWLGVAQQPKVVFMGAGLVVVLALMSTVLRNPTALLGPKATAKMAAPSQSEHEEPAPEPATEPEKHEPATEPKAVEAEPDHEAKAIEAKATEAALRALQTADPGEPEPEGGLKISAMGPEDVPTKANQGKAAPATTKSDVYVVSEGRSRTPKKATKPKPKPAFVAPKSGHSAERVKAPLRVRRPSPLKGNPTPPSFSDPLADVDVYDSDGRPIR